MSKKTAATGNTFIKFVRNSDNTKNLLEHHPNAFLLLTQIAMRARRSSDECAYSKLKQGEALIGDYRNCGLTEQKYRTAKRQLETIGLATFKTTNKGTVATLSDSTVYDINKEYGNGLANTELTGQQRANNEPITTNKNVKKDKNVKRFVKPSLQDLDSFIKSESAEKRKIAVSADEFFDFYESKGWKIGSAPMKDWKSAARRWIRRQPDQGEMPHFVN